MISVMRPVIQPICFNGRDFAVLTYRVVHGTSNGTVWRFITNAETFVVVPCQTAVVPAGAPPSVPNFIISVLRGPRNRRLAELVERIVTLDATSVKNAQGLAEIGADIRQCMAAFGVNGLSDVAVRSIFEAAWRLFPSLGRVPAFMGIRDREIRDVLSAIKAATGNDITVRVITSCTSSFARNAMDWTTLVAKKHKISHTAALELLLEEVRFVGLCSGRIDIPIQSVWEDVHDADDIKLLRAASREARLTGVKPTHPRRKRNCTTKTDCKKPGSQKSVIHPIYGKDGALLFRALSPEFARVEFKGVAYDAPPKGRSVIGFFLSEYETKGCTTFSADSVLQKIGNTGESLADAFKGYRDTWKSLFRKVPRRKGVYEFVPAVIAEGGEISGNPPG